MTEKLVAYCLEVWFTFYLMNYSEGISSLFTSIRKLPVIGYATSCAFCYTFWMTTLEHVLFPQWMPLCFIPVAPVVTLFIDLAYQCLRFWRKPDFNITRS